MKRVILVHGWDGSPKRDFLPWLKEKLEEHHFRVFAPQMPEPTVAAWVAHLAKVVGKPDKNTFFVGHSLGCIAIARYLASLPSKVGGCVLVAGFSSTKEPELKEFTTLPLDWERVKAVSRFVAISSDNDSEVTRKQSDDFAKKLNAHAILEPGFGHFCDDDHIKEVPSVLNAVLELAGD
ncbi:MAG TPA: alpha/beta fold hydrolase [Candidatus Binatia bacterium]|nr:alpha/beta fold hydrolase [Candidatus Binatia bacterium]